MYHQIVTETQEMFKYALTNGLKVPGELAKKLEETLDEKSKLEDSDKARIITDIHVKLSSIIAPAKPSTIVLLSNIKDDNGILTMFGKIPLIRHLTFTAIISLLCLLGISLSPMINKTFINQGLFEGQGLVLLFNLLFILSAASLGSSFSALYKSNDYVTEGTYDPKYESTYWSRYVLGIVSGIMLAELMPLSLFNNNLTGELEASGMLKPLFAILGGFSATAVYRLLNMFVETIEKIGKNKAKYALEEMKQLSELRLKEELSLERIKLANKLTSLKTNIKDGKPGHEEIEKMINEMLNSVEK